MRRTPLRKGAKPGFFTRFGVTHHRIMTPMDRPSWTFSLIGTAALVCALLLVAGVAVAAPPPLLPDGAFRSVPACAPVDPFSDADAAARELRLERDCGGEDPPLALRMATPRVRATDTGPSRVEFDVDKQMTLRTDFLTASARLGWGGASPDAQARLSTQRALIAANGLVRLDESLAFDLSVGQDVAFGPRSRASATALYRPGSRHFVFMQVASQDQQLVPAVGMRWWLAPRRASLDVSARRSLDGQSVEPRIGFQLSTD